MGRISWVARWTSCRRSSATRSRASGGVGPPPGAAAPGDAANTLGDLLTLWGRRLGWTQKTWALRSGLAERTVGDYLNDRKESLDLNSVMKLVRAVEKAAGTSILTTAMALADVHIARAKGCWLFDADGNRYFDGTASLWTNVHGHGDPDLDDALRNQLDQVAHTTLLSPTAGRCAEGHKPPVHALHETQMFDPTAYS